MFNKFPRWFWQRLESKWRATPTYFVRQSDVTWLYIHSTQSRMPRNSAREVTSKAPLLSEAQSESCHPPAWQATDYLVLTNPEWSSDGFPRPDPGYLFKPFLYLTCIICLSQSKLFYLPLKRAFCVVFSCFTCPVACWGTERPGQLMKAAPQLSFEH